MDNDDKKHSEQFDASLPIPGGGEKPNDKVSNPAADLIRKKVEAAYTSEPSLQEEVVELKHARKKARRSQHQQFIYDLNDSGKPMHEIQMAWHEYYAGLTDEQKHKVWQEFYAEHEKSAHHPAVTRMAPGTQAVRSISHRIRSKPARRPAVRSKRPTRTARSGRQQSSKPANPVHSLLFGLSIGGITLMVFLFSFFNERVIAPFIQPSRNVSNIPIISSTAVGPDPEVIIPKINVEIPVVYGISTIDEKTVEKGLERGVVHYADTALPGENGNSVIVGHSSNNILNRGKYKFAFVLLHKLEVGDTFYLQKDGKRYTYQIYKRTIVKPTDVSVLGLAEKNATATLITCDPPGTSNNRLVVVGEQINPDPDANRPIAAKNSLAKTASIVPGNSPTLWSRIANWFTQ